MTFAEALNEVTRAPESRDMATLGQATEALVEVACQHLEAFDPGVTVRKTGYFNHSVAPDISLAWTEDGKHYERAVFLRTQLWRAKAYARERPILGEPIVLALFTEERRDPAKSDLRRWGREEGRALISEAAAFDEFGQPDFRVANSALVRAGRGLLDQGAARTLADHLSEGYQHAQAADDAEPVTAALKALSEWLPYDQHRRLSVFFELTWVGAGGDLSELVGAETAASLAELTNEDLSAILETFLTRPERVPTRLWQLLGRHLTTDRLAELLFEAEVSDRLDGLVNANLASWTARWAARRSQETAGKEGWHITGSLLTLRERGSDLAFTALGTRFNRWPAAGSIRRLDELGEALRGHTITALSARRPGEAVVITVSAAEEESPAAVDRRLQDALGGDAEVIRAAVAVGDPPRDVTIDFERGMLISEHDVALGDLVGLGRTLVLPVGGSARPNREPTA